MFRVTRRYQFPASHRLHTARLSEDENRRVYGKCNHPFGHGHDYVLEVSVRGPLQGATGRAVDPRRLDELVAREVLEPFGYRNLNENASFAAVVPTSENLAAEIYRRLTQNWRSAFPGAWPRLEKIRIAETPRNIFEISDEIE